MIDNILPLIGRTAPLLETDIKANEKTLSEIVKNSRFLVIGGAGTIGSAICKEIFNRNPKVLHVVDISETISNANIYIFCVFPNCCYLKF